MKSALMVRSTGRWHLALNELARDSNLIRLILRLN